MKKLRKILVALAVLLLLVSSVTVLVVTAEDAMEYTGNLEEAKALLDDVPTMEENSTTDLRKVAIQKVYIYLNTYPVDPETEGYAEFEAELYAMSLKIANKYYEKLTSATSTTAREKQLTIVLNYLSAYPIPEGTPDPDGEGTEYIGYDELVTAVETFNFNMVKAYYDAALKSSEDDIKAAMQSLKSVYKHVVKFPVSENVEAAVDFYKDYNTLALVLSEKVIANLQSYKNEEGKIEDLSGYKAYVAANLSVLRDHIAACPVDLETFPEYEDRFNAIAPAISVVELDQITFLYDAYLDFEPDDDASVMPFPELARAAELAKVSKALSDSTIPETTEGYAELVEKIKNAEAELAEIKEMRRKALANQAKLEEYALTDGMSYKTFSSDSETMGNPNADRDEYSERVKTYDNGLSSGYEAYWRYVVLGEPNKHNTANVSGYANTSYASLTQPNITNGYVVSFDYMLEGTNGTHYDKVTFSNEWQNYKGDRLVGYEGNEFTIQYDSATDSICVSTGNGVPAKTIKNVAAEGQWFNVMYTYDPITHYGKLYIDYEYMFDFYFNGYVEGATRMVMRISHTSTWQNTCYDNVQFYEGTCYRDVNRFNGMSDNAMFDYYVNYFLDEGYNIKSRNEAYVKAKLLIDGIKGQYADVPEDDMTEDLKYLRTLVSQMEAFNYEDDIKSPLAESNLAEILRQVSALEEIPAYSTNVKDINKAIEVLDQYIADNNDYINKADARYNAAVVRVNAVKAGLAKCENAVAFSRALTLFQRATTVASMTRRQATLDEIYKAARYDKPENVNAVKDDPVFLAFELIINGKDALPSDPGYITAFDYYYLVPSIIAEQFKVENSNRIIKCVELLFEMEGYENTEEYWLENYDDVEFFVSIIRNIVSVDNYDPTYPGVDEAIAQYELIDAYFFVLLQEEHKAIIGAQLDRFAASNSYIEKIGICTYLNRYFENNVDIDLTLPEIQEFMYRLERYNAELETYMDDYKELLERNTQYFIDVIKKMTLLTTYAELKPLYDEALSYYYAMNAITDEAKEAVALFDSYDKALSAIEVNSELFVIVSQDLDFVDILGADIEYALLSECSGYYQYVDATYSADTAARMAVYEQLIANYNGAVDTANGVVETSALVASALRADEIPVAVLAVINQLYKNN